MTNHIIHISTCLGKGCEHCHFHIGGPDNLAESVNHYIEKHGYTLLHIGAESTGSIDSLWQSTVAVVGK